MGMAGHMVMNMEHDESVNSHAPEPHTHHH